MPGVEDKYFEQYGCEDFMSQCTVTMRFNSLKPSPFSRVMTSLSSFPATRVLKECMLKRISRMISLSVVHV